LEALSGSKKLLRFGVNQGRKALVNLKEKFDFDTHKQTDKHTHEGHKQTKILSKDKLVVNSCN